MFGQNNGHVTFYQLIQLQEAYNPDGFTLDVWSYALTVWRRGRSEMIWVATSKNSLGTLVIQHGRVINAEDYRSILVNYFYLIVETMFPERNDNAPIHTANVIQNRYKEHQSERDLLHRLTQSPNFNIIENLWCIKEQHVRTRFSPALSQVELKRILFRKWFKMFLTISSEHLWVNSSLY